MLLFDTAPLARWQLLCMWPSFWILFSSILWEMLFGSGVKMKGGRKCQLPWSMVQVLCLLPNATHRMLWGGSPTLNWQRKSSSLFAALVNKREKLEFGWKQRWIAAAEGLLPFWIKSACLRLGLDVTRASLCHSKGRFYLSLRNLSNWRAEHLSQ